MASNAPFRIRSPDGKLMPLERVSAVNFMNSTLESAFILRGGIEKPFSLADDTPEGKSILELATEKGFSIPPLSIKADSSVEFIKFTAEITLTDRADMGVPMLLGRATIRGKFIVHPGRSFLISRTKRKSK